MFIFLALVASVCGSVLAISTRQLATNCTAGSTPCGGSGVCCANGLQCNFNRAIPQCENTADPLDSGFDSLLCDDPYLFDCAVILGIPGFCCPIGTVCFNNGLNNDVSCIDAIGATSAALPSATQGFVPSATPIANDNADIVFEPPSAWDSSNAPSCSSSNSLRITSAVNSTIQFNYTGTSIMIRTITSPQGGVFSISVDGFDTTDVIDTFADANSSFPLCYPNQFPPFTNPPPDFALQNDHSIILTYLGPSPQAPNGTTTANVQFDSFAIPQLQASAATSVLEGRKKYSLFPFAVAISVASISYLY